MDELNDNLPVGNEMTFIEPREIEALWRGVGLPEYFLGNSGTNHALYAFARLIQVGERDRCANIANGCACQDSFGRDVCGCSWIESQIRGQALRPTPQAKD